MANFSLTPSPSASSEKQALAGICGDLPAEITCTSWRVRCRRSCFYGDLWRSWCGRCEWRLFGIVCVLTSPAAPPLRQPLPPPLWLRCTFHMRRAACKGQTPLCCFKASLGLREEVALSCTYTPSNFPLRFFLPICWFCRAPPLFHAFAPFAQRCLFSGTALLTFGGSEVSLVKLTNLIIRSCCLGAAQ